MKQSALLSHIWKKYIPEERHHLKVGELCDFFLCTVTTESSTLGIARLTIRAGLRHERLRNQAFSSNSSRMPRTVGCNRYRSQWRRYSVNGPKKSRPELKSARNRSLPPCIRLPIASTRCSTHRPAKHLCPRIGRQIHHACCCSAMCRAQPNQPRRASRRTSPRTSQPQRTIEKRRPRRLDSPIHSPATYQEDHPPPSPRTIERHRPRVNPSRTRVASIQWPRTQSRLPAHRRSSSTSIFHAPPLRTGRRLALRREHRMDQRSRLQADEPAAR